MYWSLARRMHSSRWLKDILNLRRSASLGPLFDAAHRGEVVLEARLPLVEDEPEGLTLGKAAESFSSTTHVLLVSR